MLAADAADEEAVNKARRSLEGFYTGEFAAAFRTATGSDPEARALVAALDDVAVWLQNLYIRANEHPPGSKARLDAATDDSAYTKTHALYHPILRNLQEKYGLYDLFLIDAESGKAGACQRSTKVLAGPATTVLTQCQGLVGHDPGARVASISVDGLDLRGSTGSIHLKASIADRTGTHNVDRVVDLTPHSLDLHDTGIVG